VAIRVELVGRFDQCALKAFGGLSRRRAFRYSLRMGHIIGVGRKGSVYPSGFPSLE